MAGSTETRRLASLLLAALLAQGCATGSAIEGARLTESPVRFEAAWTDGERLWLLYEVRIRDIDGRDRGQALRGVRLEIADLDPARGHPIDAFPLTRVKASDLPPDGAQRVELRDAGGETAAQSGERALRLQVTNGRIEGFRLHRFENAPPDGRFHSGTLVRRRTAPWVYAALPFALTYDALSLAILVPLATPLFVIYE